MVPKCALSFYWLLVCTVLGLAAGSAAPPRLGVLVHGCNTQANGWDRIVWGDVGERRMGRISHTLALVSMFQAMSDINGARGDDTALLCILWGSGVPSHEEGLTEGQFTMGVMRERFRLLRAFPLFSGMSDLRGGQLERLVAKVSISEDSSINTITEIEAAFKHFEQLGVTVIVLVSSASHAPRCLRDACKVLESWGTVKAGAASSSRWCPLLLVSPASTCYDGCSAGDVIIAEPPHLPPPPPSVPPSHRLDPDGAGSSDGGDPYARCVLRSRNRLISRILSVKQDQLADFNLELEGLLSRYEGVAQCAQSYR